MADAPIRKIMLAFAALLAPLTATVYIDRTDDEPLDDAERPGIIPRVPHIAFENYQSQGMDLCRATFHFDCHSSGTSTETIDHQNQSTVTDILAAIASDRTLGGRLQSCEAMAASGAAQDGADIGCAILEVEVVFFTDRDNPYTIVGQAGATF